jgi:hypothetical protein
VILTRDFGRSYPRTPKTLEIDVRTTDPKPGRILVIVVNDLKGTKTREPEDGTMRTLSKEGGWMWNAGRMVSIRLRPGIAIHKIDPI